MGINKLKVVLTEEAQAFLDAQPSRLNRRYTTISSRLRNGICYRLFSFWDTEEETLVIATHGIIKKTQKTPLKEIAKAEEIRKEYFNNKKK